jgi:hypothetical protein
MHHGGRRRQARLRSHCDTHKQALVPPPSLDAGEAMAAVSEARALIATLINAHRRSLVLAKELMIAQEFADAQEERANHAIAVAASDPDNGEAIDWAIEASARSEDANEDERRATAGWAGHVIEVHQLIAAVEKLPWIQSAASVTDPVRGPAAGAPGAVPGSDD